MKIKLSVLLLLVYNILPAQTIIRYGGTGSSVFSGDSGPAIAAGIPNPCDGDFDKHGNYYFADAASNRIRKVTPAGIITTVAGNGIGGYSGDSGLATSAKLNGPVAARLDTFGNIYIADAQNERIRKVDAITGIITTIAGTGVAGFFGDGGPAIDAKLWGIQGLCLDKFGNIYIADGFNYRLRKVNTSGLITTIAGNGIAGYSGENTLADTSMLGLLAGMCSDTVGNIYITINSISPRVFKIDLSGMMTTVAGNGITTYSGDGMLATNAQIAPVAVAIDSFNNLFIADKANKRVYKVDAISGILYEAAGNGIAGDSGDGGVDTLASLNIPVGVALDPCGNLYIPTIGTGTSGTGRRIRKVIYDVTSTTITPTVNVLTTSDTICSGSSITLFAAFSGGGSTCFYQWYVNGHIAAATADSFYSYTPANGDSVYCILYTGDICSNPVNATSNTVHIVVDTFTAPTIHIHASTGDTVCSGTPVSYTAITTGIGSAPVYQWVVNGIYVGASGSTYSYTPTNGDSIRCILTSGNPCSSGTISSNMLVMTVGAAEAPNILISVDPRDSICTGTPVTYSASISLGGASPIYQWKMNGSNVGSGLSTYSYTPSNGDSVRCVLTSSASCALPLTVSSNTINMVVDTFVVPTISITGSTTAFVGSTVTVNATITNAGSSYIVHWYNNGALINTTTIPTITYTKTSGIDLITATVIPASIGCYDSTTSSLFSITGINESVNNVIRPNTYIYPNPAQSEITVISNNIATVTVINLFGQIVIANASNSDTVKLNIENLSSGVYTVKITNTDGEKIITKIIKQ